VITSIPSQSAQDTSSHTGFNPGMLLSQLPPQSQLPRNPSLMPSLPLPSYTPPTTSTGDIGAVSAPASDPNQLSPEREAIMKAAKASIGLNAGVRDQCANSVRTILSKAGITNIGATSNPWDGMHPTGPGFANSFAGKDVGERKASLNDMKPGDLVMIAGRGQGYPAGTITHVGVYAGKDPQTGAHMMFDHNRSRGVILRPIESNFPGEFAGGVELKAVTSREASRNTATTPPKTEIN
jgi:hypothetical protein